MTPLTDAKVLQYLKSTNSKWKTKIEEYAKKTVPKFKFIAKYGSKGCDNRQFCLLPMTNKLSYSGEHWFVCDDRYYRIQLFNAMNGKFIKGYGSNGSNDGQFNYPYGICISPSGQIIVSEDGNNRVQIFE
jgi:hypothetical protein